MPLLNNVDKRTLDCKKTARTESIVDIFKGSDYLALWMYDRVGKLGASSYTEILNSCVRDQGKQCLGLLPEAVQIHTDLPRHELLHGQLASS